MEASTQRNCQGWVSWNTPMTSSAWLSSSLPFETKNLTAPRASSLAFSAYLVNWLMVQSSGSWYILAPVTSQRVLRKTSATRMTKTATSRRELRISR